MTEQIKPTTNIAGHLNRVLAQNFEAVPAMVVIVAVDLILENSARMQKTISQGLYGVGISIIQY